MRRLAPILVLAAACACAPAAPPADRALDAAAETYVRLVLALGQHDPDQVDTYYGPPEWRQAAEAERRPLAAIAAGADSLVALLEAIRPATRDTLVPLRHAYLLGQTRALAARTRQIAGERLAFDRESQAIYDAVAPRFDDAHFDSIVARLETMLPGTGSLSERYDRARRRFVVPRDRVDRVMRAAIRESRARTLRRVALPDSERWTVAYVNGKSWSAYNWYQGGYHSRIEINMDLPFHVEKAVGLAAHEGYPGHHVFNVMLERLVRERGWVEHTIYALFSPQSLLAEGTAEFGVEVAFPDAQRLAFERDTLFPLAGLDPSGAAWYFELRRNVRALDFSGIEAARRYLDGGMDSAQTVAWLVRYGLSTPARAAQRVRFFDQYRSYTINYAYGQELVREYVARRLAGDDTPGRRWEEFVRMIGVPLLPSGLREPGTAARATPVREAPLSVASPRPSRTTRRS